jgi:uncharacterized membrane protein affecting hemolysin expression
MEVITCSWGAKRASVTTSFFGTKTIINAGHKKITLPDDVEKTQVTQEQNEMTGGRMILIILLAVTVIGLLLAIPLYFAGKKKRMTMAIKTKAGETLYIAATTNREWNLLRKYAGIGALG